MTAKEEDELPTRAEVEQLLADERIPWDTRRDLALQYLDYIEDEDPDEVGFKDEADQNGFRDMIKERMKISEGDLNANNSTGGLISDLPGVASLEQDVHEAYSNAKAEYDKLQEGDRQSAQAAVGNGKGALDAIAGRSSETSAGAANSNEILDTGVAGLKSFEVFIPLYNRAVAVAGGGGPADLGEIIRLYDEQRDIQFAKFSAGADEYNKVKDAVAQSLGDVNGQLTNGLANWQGGAAEQARAYQASFEQETKVVEQAFADAANAMLLATGTVGKLCREKAKWVLDYYFDRLGEVTAQDLDRIIRLVELGQNASQDDFKHCVKFLDEESRTRISDEGCDLDEDTMNYIIEQSRTYLGTNFNPWFAKHIENYRLMCTNTRSGVDQAWGVLFGQLNEAPENPFSGVASGAFTDSRAGRQSQSGPAGAPPAAAGGGPPAGGMGGAPSGTAAAPPATTPPAMPEPAAEGMNPVTGKPLEVDPATGAPYAIDPATGEAVKAAGDAPEMMTVEQGGQKLSLTEPDAEGRMGISVEGADGEPKEFSLDFGDRESPGTGFGSSDGHQVHQPDDDGKIRIDDGNVKIVAERPDGPGGPTVVEVDDGSGEPARYVLGQDSAEESRSAGARDDAQSVGVRADQRSEGTTWTPPGSELPVAAAASAPEQATSAQAAGGDFITNGAAAVPTGELPDPGLGNAGPAPGESLPSGMPSGIGLGSTPGGTEPRQPDSGAAAAGAGGGMGMMGGMGAPGGGGGGGGDQERASSGAYRVNAGLFDTAEAGGRISGNIGDDDHTIGPR